MSVINPRTKLVNFRLSETEFEQLERECRRSGSRSISDFTRSAVMGRLAGEMKREATRHVGTRIASLETNVIQLINMARAIEGNQEKLSLIIAPEAAAVVDE